MTNTQTMVTETTMANNASGNNGYVMYRDEFPGDRPLSRVIGYLIQCKLGFVKSINVTYKENKSL